MNRCLVAIFTTLVGAAGCAHSPEDFPAPVTTGDADHLILPAQESLLALERGMLANDVSSGVGVVIEAAAFLAPPNSDRFRLELGARAARDQFWRMCQNNRELFARVGASDPEQIDLLSSWVNAKTRQLDAENSAWLRTQLVRRDHWFKISEVGEFSAAQLWGLALHADADRDLQQRVLDLMEPMLDTGELNKQHYAYLFDRLAVSSGKPQRFGTQGRCTIDAQWVLAELEDPPNVDARRERFGLDKLASYVAQPRSCPQSRGIKPRP